MAIHFTGLDGSHPIEITYEAEPSEMETGKAENALIVTPESALAFGRVKYDPEHPGLDFPMDMEYPEWEAIGYSLQEWQEVGP